MIDIGSNKQLFIDGRFMETSAGIALSVNQPVKAGPIHPDLPINGMISVLDFDGQYYMYFRKPHKRGCALALSEDGLNWHPAAPEASAFGEGRDLPLPGVDSGSVFLDPKEPEYPFKGIFDIRDPAPWGLDGEEFGDVQPVHKTQATARGGLFLFRSRNGFQWEVLDGLPVPFLCDTQNQMLYDERTDRYVAYLRAFPTLGGPHRNKRCVARTEVKDLYDMPWPHRANPDNKPEGNHQYPYIQDEMPVVLAADESDPPQTDLYNPMVHHYPWADDVYLAFPSMYRTWGYSGENISHGRDHRGLRSNDGLFETHVAVSRDGMDFTRYRTPYVGPGLITDRAGREGAIDSGFICMALGMIIKGDEIWQYYQGCRRTHMSREDGEKYGFQGEGIFRSVQRLDGFVSADAGHEGGELVTPTLSFKGDRLYLNAECSGLGEISAEIQTGDGKPAEGFSMDDAVTIVRNGTRQEVWWKDGPDVTALSGKPVRLRFRMRSAKLFALQFASYHS